MDVFTAYATLKFAKKIVSDGKNYKLRFFFRLQLKSTQEELDRLRDEKGASGERRRSSASTTRSIRISFLLFQGKLS